MFNHGAGIGYSHGGLLACSHQTTAAFAGVLNIAS